MGGCSGNGPKAAAECDGRDLVVSMWKGKLEFFQTTKILLTDAQGFLVLLFAEQVFVSEKNV